MNQPKVAVLVLNYCSKEDTIACVSAIRNSTYKNIYLLVIDNASPDGSGAALAQQIPPIEFLALPVNIGYAGGNNEGIRRAIANGVDHILIVNPDIRLPPDAIENYVNLLQQHPEIGAINSIQLGLDGKTIDNRFLRGVLREAGYRSEEYRETDYPEIFEVEGLFGAALMLSKTAIEKVGGFDPLYFAYGEETDLCRRLRFHGLRLVVIRDSPVIHLRTKYADGLSERVRFLMLRGYYLSEVKNPFRSSMPALRRTFRDLFSALVGNRPKQYPFNSFEIRRSILLRTILWFMIFGITAWRHKCAEKLGRTYV